MFQNNEKIKKCVHDPNLENNTLQLLSKRNLIFPQEYSYICLNCKNFYSFVKEGKKFKLRGE